MGHAGRRAIPRPAHRESSSRNFFARTVFRLGDVTSRIAKRLGIGTKVALISRHLRNQRDISLIEHDIFSQKPEWIERFHVVRVANLLNLSYFDEPTLARGLANAGSWVRDGGLLVVARTNIDGTNHATFFRRSSGQLEAIHRVGSGSEVEPLVRLSQT